MNPILNSVAVSVLAGLLFSANNAWAVVSPTVWQSAIAVASVGQSASNADRKREADELIGRARKAMKANNFEEADRLVSQAEKLNVSYDSVFNRFQDSPDKARKDLNSLRGRTVAPKTPSDRFAPPPLLTDPNVRPASATQNFLPPTEKKDQASLLTQNTAGESAFGANPTSQPGALVPPSEFGASQADRLPPFGKPASAFDVERGPAPPDTNSFRPNPNLLPANGGEFQPKQIAPSVFDSPVQQIPAAANVDAGKMLWDARRALARGDLQQAKSLVEKTRALGANLPAGGDSPERIDSLIRRGAEVMNAAASGSPDAKRNKAQYLMEQADGLLKYKDFDQADSLAREAASVGAEFRTFDRGPDKLLNSISALRRAGTSEPSNPTNSQPPGSFPKLERLAPAANSFATPVANDSPPKKETLRLVAMAQAAMDRNDFTSAQKLIEEAKSLRVPDDAFAPSETRPWQLGLELERQLNRRGGVAQASGQAGINPNGSRYPVAQSVFDPRLDRSRNMPAAAITQVEEDLSAATQPLPAAGSAGKSNGKQLFDQGMNALQKQDSATAIKLFREAWKQADQLDPTTRAQLQEKLNLMQDRTPNPLPPGREASPLEAVDAAQKLLYDKLSREIFAEQEQAQKMVQTDAAGSMQKLEKLRERVAQSQLDPAGRKQLQTMVERNISKLEQYISENRAEIDNSQRNARVIADIEQRRARKEEIQNKVAQLVDQFNQLLDEKRFPEAEVIARQALEIDGQNPVVVSMAEKSRLIRRVFEMTAIDARKEEGFYLGMQSVEDSAVGFDDREPFRYGDKKRWTELSSSRRKMLEQQRKRLSPAEIEIQKSLSAKVEVRFQNRPLKEVIETLSTATNINFYLDPQGMAVEGVTTDTPVSLNLTQPISMKSALKLILEPLRLGFVIQNEVLKITSEQTRDSDIYPQVYDVADLVIPIPNFVPGYNTGLPSAIQEAHRALGYGGSLPGAGSMPMTLASSQPQSNNASVLAQMGAGGMMPGARGQQQIGPGPGGLGGGAQADFDTLMSLLTSSVAPKTWAEVGGSGTIEQMPSNLSIVVSQTQEVHDQIADLLEQLRRLQDLQVTIEVRFITLADNFFERIGIDLDFTIDDNSGLRNANGAPPAFPDDAGRSFIVGLNNQNGQGVPTSDLDIPFSQGSFASAIPQFPVFDPSSAANFGFAILSDIEVFFLIQAAAGDQRSNVLQAPKVTLFNGQQASVFDTAQRPFVIGVIPVVGDFAAAHQPVIVVLNEGTSMSVQAVVSADRRFVRLTLVPFFSKIGQVDTFTFNGRTTSNTGTSRVDPTNNQQTIRDGTTTTTEGTTVQLPTFQFTTVTTTVSVPDGGTVLLGGIKRLSEGRTERGVPMLSKIPYINRLFKNIGIGRTAQSLMMMVTPRIIIQEEEESKLGLAPPTP